MTMAAMISPKPYSTARLTPASGVDFISAGSITHSAPQVDFGLDIVEAGARDARRRP